MDVNAYIESGILEMYVLGSTSEVENDEVEKLRLIYPDIDNEIVLIQETLEKFALDNSIEPHASMRPLALATINYINRLETGEEFNITPVITSKSKIEDFSQWINNVQAPLDASYDDIHVHILTGTPEFTSAIVWIKELAPEEVHHDEHEKFLILEGTCTIYVENEEHNLKAGDVFEIPLYKDHKVVVTSECACKVILQRIAA